MTDYRKKYETVKKKNIQLEENITAKEAEYESSISCYAMHEHRQDGVIEGLKMALSIVSGDKK